MFEKDPRYRVLVVEDSLFNQFVLQKILGDCFLLAKAMTGKEAMDQVHKFHPHLILLDIILPDANGFDILVMLKEIEETRKIPVIIITGLNSDEDEEKGFRLGAVDYIRRPFKNAIVRARVNTQIEMIRQIESVERMGLVDELTEIYNRRAFDMQIQYEWQHAVTEKTELSMLMMDVDKFKVYNDTYGHLQGDSMLRAVAKALSKGLKPSSGQVYRYGGEEFAVLLPGTGMDAALVVAERLRGSVAAINVTCRGTGQPTQETISIGASSMKPKSEDKITDLVESADQMLYKAKANGRNCVWPQLVPAKG